MEKLTDGGTYKINMSYSPDNIQPTNTTTFNLEFLDPKTNQKKDNVQYDFMIMPAENPETMLTHRAAKMLRMVLHSNLSLLKMRMSALS